MAGAGPLVDLSPILTMVIRAIPLMIVIGIIGILVNSIGRPRRRRRRRQSAESELLDEIADWIVSLIRRAISRPRTSASFMDAPMPSLWTMDGLKQLEWKRFEMLTTEFFKAIGFNAHMTRVGADGGVDVMLYHPGQDKPMGIAQCKAWTTYAVGVKPVRELYGVMAADHVQHGVFVTTSTFTQEARDFARGKNLELVDGETLLHFIKQLDRARQQNLLKTAFAGDFSLTFSTGGYWNT